MLAVAAFLQPELENEEIYKKKPNIFEDKNQDLD